ncbi:uncharacterized protein LOC143277404 [Babylonia areolata]|uniref:uncharacterized protein LOC143277404 n=1 Tax=Babylonia areolata TaxID=304850 RepID=UPI003FD51683
MKAVVASFLVAVVVLVMVDAVAIRTSLEDLVCPESSEELTDLLSYCALSSSLILIVNNTDPCSAVGRFEGYCTDAVIACSHTDWMQNSPLDCSPYVEEFRQTLPGC